jgi:flagellar biosynthesis/type III secretory pathway M-ring protein FliF/YscJ
MNMEAGDVTGVLIAIAVGVLAFVVSRHATRHFARKRADREQAVAEATQSRQVRRANQRRQR